MFRLTGSDTSCDTIVLIADHEIYRAHFPGNPITPGVCIVQIITELLQLRLDCALRLNTVISLKFVNTISPIDDPTVTVNFASVDVDNEAGTVRVKGTIVSPTEVKTKFSLLLERDS